MAQTKHCAMALQIRQGRINESWAKAIPSDQRPAGATAPSKRLAQDRACEKGRSLGRFRIQRREKHWSPEALIKDAVSSHKVGNADIPLRVQETSH